MKYKTSCQHNRRTEQSPVFPTGSTCFLIPQANNTTITSKVTQKRVEQKAPPLLSSTEHTVMPSRQTLVMVALLFCSL
uniref:Uncharacterized protein n=1 Tax=Anguilla anguilla TaxID=7936 RepID=A0A0E9V867_ANGAN